MIPRTQQLATLVWTVIAAAASLGFLARDVLGLPNAAVALAWIAGALAGGALAGARRRRAEHPEGGASGARDG